MSIVLLVVTVVYVVMRLEVCTVVSVRIIWDLTLCSLVAEY
jgi:hypothetical protein